MARLIQASFAKGELAPDLYGRVDISAFPVALRTALNMIVHSSGGISNRPGLKFVGPCATHSGTTPRLIAFKYNTEDAYILEFGELYMRVIRSDAHVLNAAKTITGITAASPGVVTTSGAHGYTDGQDVYIDSVVGMTEVNGRWFTVANKTSTTFELTSQQTGSSIDTSGYTAYSSAGSVSSVYELTTPYALADVRRLKVVQSANVMTIAHPSYPPYELTRTDHDAWTITAVTFAPAQAYPTAFSVTDAGSGTDRRYQVTATNAESAEESLPGLNTTTSTITGATAANPVVITSASHPYLDGDEVEINSIVGMTELNGRRFTVANKATNTFELLDEDGTSHTAYSSGGTANATFFLINGGGTPAGSLSWTGASGAGRYSVYREDNGLFGWLGDTELTSFTDTNMEVDLTLTPPKARNPFYGTDNYPATVSYYEQRRLAGNTNNAKDTNYYSVTGSEDNMSQSSPRQADDAITAALNSSEVNEIRSYVPLNDLIIMTSGGEWRINSGADVGFSAETLRQKPQSNWGSAWLEPIVIGDKVLFVTENSTYVRSIGYEITIDGYKGNDMTVFAQHMLRTYSAVAWAHVKWPDSIIPVVRSDGVAGVLTFNPEQEVVAWTRWDTDGKFLDVASIRPSSSDTEDSPYFIVQRTIGGSSAFYIERLASRKFSDVRDCFFVDSGLSLDSPVTITGATAADPVVITAASHPFSDGDEVDITDIIWEPTVDTLFNKVQPSQLNGGRYFVASSDTNTFELVELSGRVDITGATAADPVVITATAHGLTDGDVIGIFNVAGMTELNGNTYKVSNGATNTFELTSLAGVDTDGSGFTAYTSGGTAYPAADGSAFNAYKEGGEVRECVLTLSSAWHLEGEEVVILADGNVVTGKTVANGAVTLARKASRVHMGLRVVADFETLSPEVAVAGQTIQGRKMRTPIVTVRMKESRGLLVGSNAFNLTEDKQRTDETYGTPIALLTEDREMNIDSDWEDAGRVFIRQPHPLPLTITGVILNLDLGDDEDD